MRSKRTAGNRRSGYMGGLPAISRCLGSARRGRNAGYESRGTCPRSRRHSVCSRLCRKARRHSQCRPGELHVERSSRGPGRCLIRSIRHSYGNADMALRVAPGLPLSGISKVVDIGPIAEPALSERERLRSYLGISPSEQLVLVAFGGIPLDTLPWDRMVEMKGYQFLLGGLSKVPSARIHSLSAIPFSFKTALASVDVVMTKPGYGTILEAVALGLPVVYVRRYTFADEAPLVEFLHKHGQGLELSRNDFVCGNWRSTFEALADCKKVPTPPPMTGAADAAQALVFHFQ
jgi:hypothetical protein